MVKEKKSILDSIEAEVMDGAGQYYKEKIKKKIMKIGEFSILVFLALILISFGIASLIGFYFPQLNNGLNFVILGMMFLITGMLIRF